MNFTERINYPSNVVRENLKTEELNYVLRNSWKYKENF